MSESNAKLNCAVGDLAITVNCRIPANLGNIERIISSGGFQGWQGYLLEEFSESEQLQMQLYEQDCVEGVE
jgi:hypothetical protein